MQSGHIMKGWGMSAISQKRAQSQSSIFRELCIRFFEIFISCRPLSGFFLLLDPEGIHAQKCIGVILFELVPGRK